MFQDGAEFTYPVKARTLQFPYSSVTPNFASLSCSRYPASLAEVTFFFQSSIDMRALAEHILRLADSLDDKETLAMTEGTNA